MSRWDNCGCPACERNRRMYEKPWRRPELYGKMPGIAEMQRDMALMRAEIDRKFLIEPMMYILPKDAFGATYIPIGKPLEMTVTNTKTEKPLPEPINLLVNQLQCHESYRDTYRKDAEMNESRAKSYRKSEAEYEAKADLIRKALRKLGHKA